MVLFDFLLSIVNVEPMAVLKLVSLAFKTFSTVYLWPFHRHHDWKPSFAVWSLTVDKIYFIHLVPDSSGYLSMANCETSEWNPKQAEGIMCISGPGTPWNLPGWARKCRWKEGHLKYPAYVLPPVPHWDKWRTVNGWIYVVNIYLKFLRIHSLTSLTQPNTQNSHCN